MRCPYCGCSNGEDEHRCRRCGRRLQPLPAVAYPVENSAAVRAPEPVAPAAPAAPAAQQRPARRTVPRQAALFGAPERPNIIPFETIAPDRVSGHLRSSRARRQAAPRQAAAQQTGGGQQNLFPPAPAARPSAAPHSAVHDEAAIAPLMLRVQAAAADAALCGIGLAVAAAAFHFMGGRFIFTKATALFWAGAAGAIVLFYHAFWSILGSETAGMHGCGLRVLTFDGNPPAWKQRVLRLAAAGMGLGALGLGILWTLTDEETLAWHDHITQTFPAATWENPSSFHRR
jgi:uncharacterized RDD family membrane protein YckC